MTYDGVSVIESANALFRGDPRSCESEITYSCSITDSPTFPVGNSCDILNSNSEPVMSFVAATATITITLESTD